jgi:hypothetical protein
MMNSEMKCNGIVFEFLSELKARSDLGKIYSTLLENLKNIKHRDWAFVHFRSAHWLGTVHVGKYYYNAHSYSS